MLESGKCQKTRGFPVRGSDVKKKRGRPAMGNAPTFLVRLPGWHRAKLGELTRRTHRSITAEVQLALEAYYRAQTQ